MRIIRNIARFIIGSVFIFSGFVKAIDPWGSAYKFSDYFEAFGMDFLMPFSFAFALILSTSELLIGLNLFLKVRMHLTAWALLVFMSSFTLLTLVLAITNPISDCGCFGDAIILTNWQTFLKNLIFMVPTWIVFHQRKSYITGLTPATEWAVTGFLAIVVLFVSVYSIRNLPLFDFLPYKTGANIPLLMEMPEGMPTDEYETILVYEKDGVTKEFTLDSPEKPWSDTTWTWKETRNTLVKKGYVPPIHDFSLVSQEGTDITDNLLADPGYSFLIISSDIRKSSKRGLKAINDFAVGALEEGYQVYGMTSSTPKVVREETETIAAAITFYTTDETTLKTMIRCNPGLILIKEGVVLGKWHHRNIPLLSDLGLFGGLSHSLLAAGEGRSDGIAIITVLLIGMMGLILYYFRSWD